MGKAIWTQGNLWNLLNLTNKELLVLYPEYSEGTIKGKKAYWKKKLEQGKIEMPEKPNPEQTGFNEIVKLHNMTPELMQEFTDQGYHVGFIKNSEGEIEYTLPLPHARTGRRNPEGMGFEPASPAKITPDRRKPADRPYKLLFAFSDAQIDYRRTDEGLEPIHDERALKAARLLCRDLQPDMIVNLGDTVDLAVLSRFKPDSDHFQRTLGPAFQRVHDMYAGLRADNPNARIVEVDSNHNTRLKNFFLKQAPEFYMFKRPGDEEDAWPTFSYPGLANLKSLGVEWISGYGGAELVYGEEYDKPPIVFKHGTSMVSSGSTANKESKDNPETHVVRGHGHRAEMHTRTTRAGNYLSAIMVGTLCSIEGDVPSYHSAVDDRNRVVPNQENWQNGVLVIRDYGGDYQFDTVFIRKGVAHYNGKEYRGDVE